MRPSLLEDALEVLLGVDVGAGGDEGAAGQLLLEVGVLAPVQLVDRQLPHRVRPRRAVLVADQEEVVEEGLRSHH